MFVGTSKVSEQSSFEEEIFYKIPNFSLHAKRISYHLVRAEVNVGAKFIKRVYREIISLYRKIITVPGFSDDEIPIEYLESNHKNVLIDGTKVFVLKLFVVDFLIRTLVEHGMIVVNDPRLTDVSLGKKMSMIFTFDCSIVNDVTFPDWQTANVRIVRRKRYRDVNKQINNTRC
jgi:FKBP-type peptidyl-prolyl cis-trans isomerase (trigger factor)